MKRIILTTLVMLVAGIAIGGAKLPKDNYSNRLDMYLLENGIEPSERSPADIFTKAISATEYEIVIWDVSGVEAPTVATFPTAAEGDLLLLPRRYLKKQGKKYVEKSQAQKDQADAELAGEAVDVEEWPVDLEGLRLVTLDYLNAINAAISEPAITTKEFDAALKAKIKGKVKGKRNPQRSGGGRVTGR